MRVKQITKKTLSLLLSVLMLLTSVPMPSFSQVEGIKNITGDVIDVSQLVKEGYLREIKTDTKYYKKYPVQIFTLNEGADLRPFNLGHDTDMPGNGQRITAFEGEKIYRRTNGETIMTQEEKAHLRPYAETNSERWRLGLNVDEFYSEEVDKVYQVKKPFTANGQEFKIEEKLGGNGGNLSKYTKEIMTEYQFSSYKDLMQPKNVAPLTEEQVKSLVNIGDHFPTQLARETELFSRAGIYAQRWDELYVMIIPDNTNNTKKSYEYIRSYYKDGASVSFDEVEGRRYYWKQYKPVPEMGPYWYKNEEYFLKARKVLEDIPVIIDGKKQIIKEGSWVSTRVLEDGTTKLVILPDGFYDDNPFHIEYAKVEKIYAEQARRVNKFFFEIQKKVDAKLASKGTHLIARTFAKTKLYKKFIHKNPDQMMREIQEQSKKKLGRKVENKIARRVLGIWLFFAITLITAPNNIKAENMDYVERYEIIEQDLSPLSDNDSKDIVEENAYIAKLTDDTYPNAEQLRTTDIYENGAKYFLEILRFMPEMQILGGVEQHHDTVKAEDAAAEEIADNIVKEVEEEASAAEAETSKEVEGRAYNGVVNSLEKDVKNHY